MIYNYPQGNLNCSHDNEDVSRENKSKYMTGPYYSKSRVSAPNVAKREQK